MDMLQVIGLTADTASLSALIAALGRWSMSWKAPAGRPDPSKLLEILRQEGQADLAARLEKNAGALEALVQWIPVLAAHHAELMLQAIRGGSTLEEIRDLIKQGRTLPDAPTLTIRTEGGVTTGNSWGNGDKAYRVKFVLVNRSSVYATISTGRAFLDLDGRFLVAGDSEIGHGCTLDANGGSRKLMAETLRVKSSSFPVLASVKLEVQQDDDGEPRYYLPRRDKEGVLKGLLAQFREGMDLSRIGRKRWWTHLGSQIVTLIHPSEEVSDAWTVVDASGALRDVPADRLPAHADADDVDA